MRAFIILLFLCCLGSVHLLAQEFPKQADVVRFHKKGKIKKMGFIQKQFEDGSMIFRDFGGNDLIIFVDEIKAVEKTAKRHLYHEDGRRVKVLNWYILLEAAANRGSDPFESGVALRGVIGKYFNRWISVGLGGGYSNFQSSNVVDDFNYAQDFDFIPAFVEFRSILFPKEKLIPFINTRIGYGFAAPNYYLFDEDDFVKGGIQYGASAGIMVARRIDAQLLFSIGYTIQHSSSRITINPLFGELPITIDNHKLNFRRLEIGVSLLY